MKLHKCDMMSSHNEFSRYARSYKLIPTTSMTHPVNNKPPNLYSGGAMLSNFINKGRLTTTKPTFIALPSLISHSTFCECSKGTPCPARTSHHSLLMRPVVIISYSLCLERKIMLSSTSIIRWKTKKESTLKALIYLPSWSGTFPLPGKKDHVTIDIYYSLEDQKGIHTEDVDLLTFKEWNNLPSWYPIFQIPYQIDVKVTCTGFYIYIKVIYIDSSRDPEIFVPYVYNDPSDEFIRQLCDFPSNLNYISDH